MRRCLSDTHGVATIEYVIVLVLVSLGATTAVIGLGTLLLDLFLYQQALLLLPLP